MKGTGKRLAVAMVLADISAKPFKLQSKLPLLMPL